MLTEARRRLQLVTADGVRLAATIDDPDGATKAMAVLVHGLTGTSGDAHLRELVGVLTSAGYGVLSYDSRGHGASAGTCTLGDAEQADVAAAVAESRQHHDRVLTIGASMGAVAVLRHAVHDRALEGVVAVSCPAQWRLHSPQAALGALMTRTRAGRRVLLRTAKVRMATTWSNAEPPEALIGRVTAPVALVHGAVDRFIPSGQSRLLAERATGPCRIDIVAGMGHAYGPRSSRPVLAAADWALAAG